MQGLTIPREAGQTRTSEILDILRDDIVAARLAPGLRLRFDALREQYSVGVSPLREALTHLASEGLVVAEQRKGFQVAPISRADLQEIALLRSNFDALAIAESIRNGDEMWEGRVIAAFHALTRRSKIGADGEINKDWETFHIRFHQELVSECALPKLLSFRAILEHQARRYRKISVRYLIEPRDDLGEHRAIHDAVLARNSEAAARLIREHYLRTVEIILSRSEGMPKTFYDCGPQ